MSVKERVNASSIEDDDEDEERSEDAQTPTKASRHIAGLTLGAEKAALASRKEQKVASIIDSIFKDRAIKTPEDEKEKKKDQQEPEPIAEGTETDNEAQTSDETNDETVKDKVLLSEHTDAGVETEQAEDEAWEEGEFEGDSEIHLRSRSPVEVPIPMAASTGESDSNEDEPVEVETSSFTAEESVDVEPAEPVVDMDDGGEAPPPPDPPEDDPEDTPAPDPTPRHTASPFAGYFTPRPGESFTRSTEDTRTRTAELSDVEYRAEKRGQRRGVLAGLAAGWFIGRRGKKKMAKGYEQAIKSKDGEIKDLKKGQFTAKERLEAIQRNQETIQSAIASKESRPVAAPLEVSGVPSASAERIQNHVTEANKETSRVEALQPTHKAELVAEYLAAEKLRQTARAEHHPLQGFAEIAAAPLLLEKSRHEASAHKAFKKELPPEDQEITEETYKTADGRRVESSSWHRIEVDEKTGKVVDNPEVAYGEEFRRETQKEIIKTGRNNDSPAAVQLGSMATTASVHGGSGGTAMSGASPSFSPPLAPRQTSTYDPGLEVPRPTAKLPQGKPLAKDPIIWAAGIALVVILFILATMF